MLNNAVVIVPLDFSGFSQIVSENGRESESYLVEPKTVQVRIKSTLTRLGLPDEMHFLI